MDSKKPLTGECPRCGYVCALSGGLIAHHKRLRRHKWLPCPGIAQKPHEIDWGLTPMRTVPPLDIDDATAQHMRDGTIPYRVLRCPAPLPDPGEFQRNMMQLERPAVKLVDKRASSQPDEPRYSPGPDPENPNGPPVILDRLTGEVVYRRRTDAPTPKAE